MSPTDHAHLRERVGTALGAFFARQRKLLRGVDAALVPVVDSIERFVLSGGKRLRPAFAYWGYRGASGADSDEVMTAVAALELLQASALIHDDLMDASDTRRGEPAVHRRFASMHARLGWHGDAEAFGAGSAILLGDLCLVWSDEMLSASGLHTDALRRARPVFDLMRTEVIAGQYLDAFVSATGDTSVARASAVARLKSAKYTVERPLLLGAAMAGAGRPLRDGYSAYGLPLGEAFQLRDDILGVFGDPGRTGKPAGDDLREGKRTHLIAIAFTNADAATRAELEQGLGNRHLDAAGVERLRQVLVRTGALDETERRIANLTASALAALKRARLPEPAAAVLAELAGAATVRQI